MGIHGMMVTAGTYKTIMQYVVANRKDVIVTSVTTANPVGGMILKSD